MQKREKKKTKFCIIFKEFMRKQEFFYILVSCNNRLYLVGF